MRTSKGRRIAISAIAIAGAMLAIMTATTKNGTNAATAVPNINHEATVSTLEVVDIARTTVAVANEVNAVYLNDTALDDSSADSTTLALCIEPAPNVIGTVAASNRDAGNAPTATVAFLMNDEPSATSGRRANVAPLVTTENALASSMMEADSRAGFHRRS